MRLAVAVKPYHFVIEEVMADGESLWNSMHKMCLYHGTRKSRPLLLSGPGKQFTIKTALLMLQLSKIHKMI